MAGNSELSKFLERPEAWLCSNLFEYLSESLGKNITGDSGDFQVTKLDPQPEEGLLEIEVRSTTDQQQRVLAICTFAIVSASTLESSPLEESEDVVVEVDDLLDATIEHLEPYFTRLEDRLTEFEAPSKRCQNDYLSSGKSVCVSFTTETGNARIAFDFVLSGD